MDKIKIAILTAKNIMTSTGSTNTVLNLLDNLDASKYEISIVTIDGLVPEEMKVPDAKLAADPSYVDFAKVKEHAKVTRFLELETTPLSELKKIAQVAIVAIYNVFGEDGRLIGLLETAGIPYLSPSLKTSAVCFDKEMTKAVLRGNGVPVPKGFEVHKKEFDLTAFTAKIEREFAYPVIIKTTSSGASRGV